MREVLEGKFWTGNAHEARNPELLYQLGVRVVIDLAVEESPAVLPRELAYVRCPIDDGESASREMLRLAIVTASSLVKEGIPTLVACSAGLSRSPSVAAAAMSVHTGRSLHEMVTEVGNRGPTDISPALLGIVASICEEVTQ
ncbi:Dual specificity phosphatase, catalytic domain [Botrimarina colliarenosi]|uniref:Dual specificity phosphatase, catalytic domain n=1 Tax=Botrimarina colliarenosi TaxID=2528001 RepID=A0A5C6AF45_9BACT|nr:dual specificity protein phosphatase family protein [Botrimarina colliarenosi]TWT96843.1 Dual specificity phosphatase, catalytic domain [Botrimarina colliarenosi]